MSLNRNIDDWFLGYKTRAVKGKDAVFHWHPASNSPHQTA